MLKTIGATALHYLKGNFCESTESCREVATSSLLGGREGGGGCRPSGGRVVDVAVVGCLKSAAWESCTGSSSPAPLTPPPPPLTISPR